MVGHRPGRHLHPGLGPPLPRGLGDQQRAGPLADTYWMSGSDAHLLTGAELATAHHEFWLDDHRELDRFGRGTPDTWATYAPGDRARIPSQHGLQARYFVRHGAEPDLPTRVENARRALERTEANLRTAQGRRDRAEETLLELEAALTERNTSTANPGAHTEPGPVHNHHPPYRPTCHERRTPGGHLCGECLNDDGTPR